MIEHAYLVEILAPVATAKGTRIKLEMRLR